MSSVLVKETLYTYQGQPRRMACVEFTKDERLHLLFQFYVGEHLIGVLDAHQVDVQTSLRDVTTTVQLFNLRESKQRELVKADLFAPLGHWQAHMECRANSVHVVLGGEPKTYEEVCGMTIVRHSQ